jgi:pimeloyl-ACP methyl ester carboxylesterase
MPNATVNGLDISYDLLGDGDRTWAITPGGRFSKDDGGVRELGEALAAQGQRALIWDRPNCGASQVCFTGESESTMQADTLAALIDHLGLGPTVIIGGSGGARVSMLTVARHPEVAAGLAIWWISGGPFGLMSLAVHYCGQNLVKAWTEGMEAVADLPEWEEVQRRNPSNRQRILDQDRREFVETMERWMLVYYPRDDQLVPGLDDADAARITVPTLVFRSGESDAWHTRATSEAVAAGLPNARLVEPPWGDREWLERSAAHQAGEAPLFTRWPLLAPTLLEWAGETIT